MAFYKNPRYDLKRKYKAALEISIILSLVIIILAFKYLPRYSKDQIKKEASQELVQVEDVVMTKQETPLPPPPKPAIPIEAPIDAVLEDIEFEDTELNLEEKVTTLPPPPPIEKDEEIEEEEPVFFIAVEEMPSPIGGIAAIQKSIVYPEIARRAAIQGRVFVKAYVDKNGKVHKVEIIKGIGGGCDEAALEAVKKVKFNPGKQRGKPVPVQVSIPILFKLRENT
ncbi:MAG: energy transducer TonB [Ignavibacteriae bacterium]|nr:energy transducer TonB [Ignavibacteriota bacterium]NOG96464.1 energy transducer TonB [Ignavibacteriota bacterium]